MSDTFSSQEKPISAAIWNHAERQRGVMRDEPNELHMELLNICCMNPLDAHISSSRKQMFSSHLGQCLVLLGSTVKRLQSGAEREFGKYTFSTKIPVDCVVIKVIPRYKETYGPDSVLKSQNDNPETVIIYEHAITKEVGCVSVKGWTTNHPYFGFRNKMSPELNALRQDSNVAAGTILTNSPSVDADGNYRYGREMNIAYMSHPATSEDGILISDKVLKDISFKKYESRFVEFGNKSFPLNAHGDEKVFKAFPDIGDFVRPDGLLMALRPYEKTDQSYDRELGLVTQSVYDLMEIDHVFDKLIYADGEGGRIVDIRVHHDTQANNPPTPLGMDVQALKYDQARRIFYGEIVHEWKRLERERRDSLKITPEFHRLVYEALGVVQETKERVFKLYRKSALDDWRIEFVIEYTVTPTIGFKLTGSSGNKGVICHVLPHDQMPRDADGNVADIVMDPSSVVNRMNPSTYYEPYINAFSRDTSKQIRNWFGLQEGDRHALRTIQEIEQNNRPLFEQAWHYLMRYYEIVSPKMHAIFVGGGYKKTSAEHMAAIVKDGIYIWKPTDCPRETTDIVRMLEAEYQSCYGPVTYVGNSGRRVVTKVPVRIGSTYMILLEKTADDWSAVSSGRTQHYGVLAQVGNQDKHSLPYRSQPIRAFGEAEIRITAAYTGPRLTAEILDRNNNPETHRAVVNAILESDFPTVIYNAVDRNKIPLGGARPLQHVKHILACSGVEFVYEPYKPPRVEDALPQETGYIGAKPDSAYRSAPTEAVRAAPNAKPPAPAAKKVAKYQGVPADRVTIHGERMEDELSDLAFESRIHRPGSEQD